MEIDADQREQKPASKAKAAKASAPKAQPVKSIKGAPTAAKVKPIAKPKASSKKVVAEENEELAERSEVSRRFHIAGQSS
jgi:hypothetical protein